MKFFSSQNIYVPTSYASCTTLVKRNRSPITVILHHNVEWKQVSNFSIFGKKEVKYLPHNLEGLLENLTDQIRH